jgi:DNA-binding transcriptional MocR family regulator
VLLLLEKFGLQVLEVPTSLQTGMCLDGVREALQREDVTAPFLIPNYSNPTGSLMPEANKQALYDRLVEHDLPLIEDDIYGDLYIGDARSKPVKTFDRDVQLI